jgi:cathepsin L
VTSVKNQGLHCGSCWAFSATGALEGQTFVKTNKLVSLSEQNLIDCSTSYGNFGCHAGSMTQAFKYIRGNQGIDTETSYPYEGKVDHCQYKQNEIGATDSGFTLVTRGDEEALKQAIAVSGPVSVAIDASHVSFKFFKGTGVYYEPQCSHRQLTRGVLAVGYGTSEKGEDYYLVKNRFVSSF